MWPFSLSFNNAKSRASEDVTFSSGQQLLFAAVSQSTKSLSEALQGKIPGVDAEKLLCWHCAAIATHNNISMKEVLRGVQEDIELLRSLTSEQMEVFPCELHAQTGPDLGCAECIFRPGKIVDVSEVVNDFTVLPLAALYVGVGFFCVVYEKGIAYTILIGVENEKEAEIWFARQGKSRQTLHHFTMEEFVAAAVETLT